MKRRNWRRSLRIWGPLALAVVGLIVIELLETEASAPAPADDEAAVAEAYREERSDFMVELVGEVRRLLPDDDEGSRHQRFILHLGSGQTLLVAHNIDLAPRVPLKTGDRVRLRGEYEWSERGGVLHWTHHDPQGRREGGWIEYGGRRFE